MMNSANWMPEDLPRQVRCDAMAVEFVRKTKPLFYGANMRYRFIMLMSQVAGVTALAVAALYCRHAEPERVVFKNPAELKDFAMSKGLVFHCGNISNTVYVGDYFLADHPITIDDLEGICTRRDCGLTPAWRGVLWACQRGHLGLREDCLGGKWRVWGKVLVAGDEELMDRIEGLYRNR
jgi:hypothetical protein